MTASAVCPRSERVGADLCHARGGSENRFKRRRQKTVTWPIDQKICEVRLFVVDDAPSSLGVAVQENLQCMQGKALAYNEGQQSFGVWGAKCARLEHDNVPPGFGLSSGAAKARQPNTELDVEMAVTAPWHQPHKFLLDASWLWADGEESLEVALQHQRERRFFEAFYPRLASIPSSPSEPQESSDEIDDALVAQVPLVPLEEEETVYEDTDQESIDFENKGAVAGAAGIKADSLLPTSDSSHNATVKQMQETNISIADSNIAAAAAAACMVVKALGESNLVDEKLLLEILKNPSLLKSLTSSSFTKGKNLDYDSCPPRVRQIAQESQNCKLSIDCGAHLNRSPLSVLAQWGDGIDTTNTQRLAPIMNTRTRMEQSTNSNSLGMNLQPSLWRHTSHACSNSESSTDLVQKGSACILREHKQVPGFSKMSQSNLNGPSSLQDFGSRVKMGSKNDHASINTHTHHKQAPLLTTSPFRVNPTPLPTKDLPTKPAGQAEPLKHRSAEASSPPRKNTAYSSTSKLGGRAKRLCMYFNTPRGCRNGESCAFIHQSLGSGANALAQVSSLSARSVPS